MGDEVARKLFWVSANGWPEDEGRYVFLGRALDRVGKALFPTAWQFADLEAGESNRAARRRLRAVREIISMHCAAGLLRSSYYDERARKFFSIRKTWWTLGEDNFFFVRCSVDLNDPYGQHPYRVMGVDTSEDEYPVYVYAL